jgi:hypothetical protein
MFVALSLKTNIPGRNGASARSMHQPDAPLLSEKRLKHYVQTYRTRGLLLGGCRHRDNYKVACS